MDSNVLIIFQWRLDNLVSLRINHIMARNPQHNAFASFKHHSYRPKCDLHLGNGARFNRLASIMLIEDLLVSRKSFNLCDCMRSTQEPLRSKAFRGIKGRDFFNRYRAWVIQMVKQLAVL